MRMRMQMQQLRSAPRRRQHGTAPSPPRPPRSTSARPPARWAPPGTAGHGGSGTLPRPGCRRSGQAPGAAPARGGRRCSGTAVAAAGPVPGALPLPCRGSVGAGGGCSCRPARSPAAALDQPAPSGAQPSSVRAAARREVCRRQGASEGWYLMQELSGNRESLLGACPLFAVRP